MLGREGWDRLPGEVQSSPSLERLNESSQEVSGPGREKCLAKTRERNYISSQKFKVLPSFFKWRPQDDSNLGSPVDQKGTLAKHVN